ncbi:ureidoglycine aminohydrolase [Pyrus ussuriensis x Pyrus communis]|uniref:Ureidoglycine aminohydrolase n=1 Tax=Pyrus ussuriensis x Pyrus communis TaxID=2448454 RepID=A0A5N5HWS3_9ROSA|nr:ureidoglycine aminohydrolase [Pyrus ussuriensis x Pyrus communis]
MTSRAYLITPTMGSHFVIYLARCKGAITLTNVFGISYKLMVNSYAYLPPNADHSLRCDASPALGVFERSPIQVAKVFFMLLYKHVSLENQSTKLIIGSTDEQPLLETPGEILDFQPGEYLHVKVLVSSFLFLLEGQDIYRLGDSWYPVQAGHVIWMAPFVAALGKSRTRYFLYKDVNRNPL